MSKETINLGVAPSGVGGDTPRSAFTKCNANFDELYTGLANIPSVTPIAKGGTGAQSATSARTNLGLKSAAIADIMGTVSQTSGNPTGAIMEIGSNANGSYVKYACGMMICWQRVITYSNLSAQYGSVYYSGITWTFPAPFVGNLPATNLQAFLTGRITYASPTSGQSLLDTGYFLSEALGPAAGDYTCHWSAIGRWF